jgi:hypothetical protein
MLWFSELVLTLLPFAAVNVASPTPSTRDKFDWSSKKALIAFGDSYTYVQGTHGHQNYSFIADQLNFSYDAETLLSNKIMQNQVSTCHIYRLSYISPKAGQHLTKYSDCNRRGRPQLG